MIPRKRQEPERPGAGARGTRTRQACILTNSLNIMSDRAEDVDIIARARRLQTVNAMKFLIKHTLGLYALLLALWLGLSGQTSALMLTLGLFSVTIIIYLSVRMDRIDKEIYPAHMTILTLRFWLFLAREIIVANIDVIKRIFRPGKSISPQMLEVPLTQETDVARVIYANAITMTPGTVSMHLDKKTITVHTLSAEAADDLRSGRMASAMPVDYEERPL